MLDSHICSKKKERKENIQIEHKFFEPQSSNRVQFYADESIDISDKCM